MNIYGWKCTTCEKHNSMWVGRCSCGEVRVSEDGSIDLSMMEDGRYHLPKHPQKER